MRLSFKGRKRDIVPEKKAEEKIDFVNHYIYSTVVHMYTLSTAGNVYYNMRNINCSLSLRRAAHGSKRMFLELIHGLFIT